MDNKSYFEKKVVALKEHLLPVSSVLIVMHNYPDPDCIASAFGMQQLLYHWGVKTVQITFGGFVGRAENRAMIRFLNIQAVPINLIDITDFEKIVVVDAFPGDANLTLDPGRRVDAVIDHHPHKVSKNAEFYSCIQQETGATATLVTQYLRAAQCPIPPGVATALFYGIKTDTHYLSRDVTPDDLACYQFLFDLIDHRALSRIESPDRDADYFRVLRRSTASIVVYGESVGYIYLGSVSAPDYIAEIADLFHSLESLEWMICAALFKNRIFFSIRSKRLLTAGRIAEKIARGMKGSGGGHSNIGAGQIPLHNVPADEAMARFTDTFKSILKIKNAVAEPL